MDRDQFASLPLSVALGIIYDMAPQRLADTPMPPLPRPPKYDSKFSKKRGFYAWISEMALSDLEWWYAKKRESQQAGTEYSERDGKTADTLERWIQWRKLFPNEQWTGVRGEDRAVGAPPSKDPRLHAWDNAGRSNGTQRNAPKSEPPPPPEDDFNF